MTGNVNMIGDNQEINGENETYFYNLNLEGGSNKKNMLNNNKVYGILNLNDSELATNDNKIWVENTDTNAIIWNYGFVSSEFLGGYLYRQTNSNYSYIFPVGSNDLSDVYRPIVINPNSSQSTYYGVRLSTIDPNFDISGRNDQDIEGVFDTASKSVFINNINTKFYHNIISRDDLPADIAVYYHQYDGIYETMAQWSFDKSWKSTNFTNTKFNGYAKLGSPDMVSKVYRNNNFRSDVFSLSNRNELISVNQFLSLNGDDKNNYFIVENIESFEKVDLKIFNRWGALLYHSPNYKNNWSGEVNESFNVYIDREKTLPSGTYFYILEMDNQAKSGFIELTR